MIQFHKGTQPGWYYMSVAGWRPFDWAKHGGWFCLSLQWLLRFSIGARLDSARYRNRDTFYDYKVGPVFWRNRYRHPASQWFMTFGRVVIRKWWVPGPELAA